MNGDKAKAGGAEKQDDRIWALARTPARRALGLGLGEVCGRIAGRLPPGDGGAVALAQAGAHLAHWKLSDLASFPPLFSPQPPNDPRPPARPRKDLTPMDSTVINMTVGEVCGRIASAINEANNVSGAARANINAALNQAGQALAHLRLGDVLGLTPMGLQVQPVAANDSAPATQPTGLAASAAKGDEAAKKAK